MSTHVPGFSNFLSFLHHFELAKLATSSIRVKFYVNSYIYENYAPSLGHELVEIFDPSEWALCAVTGCFRSNMHAKNY